jgi:D-glycero-beta-D-manno-heptose 1-phosphate adenylyltransferase
MNTAEPNPDPIDPRHKAQTTVTLSYNANVCLSDRTLSWTVQDLPGPPLPPTATLTYSIGHVDPEPAVEQPLPAPDVTLDGQASGEQTLPRPAQDGRQECLPHGNAAPCQPLLAASNTDKIVDLPALLALRERYRQAGQTVVWTNGCFDLLHAGHVRGLQAARRMGDVLIVGLNSDASVRRLKGGGRPILAEQDRAEILAALECVAHVLVFDDLLPTATLEMLRPEVHCKGSDYTPPHGKAIPERSVVEAYGGRVEFLPLVSGLSTSELIQRVHQLGGRPDAASA